MTETGSWSGSINYTDVTTGNYALQFDSTQNLYTREYSVTIDPSEFNRKNGNAPMCFYRIGAFRHDYKLGKGHNTDAEYFVKNKFSTSDALEYYLGTRNSIKIKDSTKWFDLQRKICEDFIKFLNDLKKWSEEQDPIYN